ncbi:glycosyltransferase family 4 protein [Gammaproteobacteria bacterium]|nr:glycosyltransferase family 4 protein [Gammaproteobacteria bacterium]
MKNSNRKAKKDIIILSANTSWYLYNFRASTITEFLNDGFQVLCLSPKDDYSFKLTELGCEWHNISLDNKGLNPLNDFKFFLELFFFFKKQQPLAVFNFTIKNNIYGAVASKILGLYTINNISGLGTAFIREGLLNKFIKALYKITMPLADKIYCQNIEDYNAIKDLLNLSAQKISLLPGSGVNPARFHPSLKVAEPKRIFTFVFIGRMLRDKGLEELVRAVKLVNSETITCKLVLCGIVDHLNQSAIPLHQIEGWGEEPDISWIGSTDKAENVLAQSDCLVLPSYREGMPKTILEACSMEIPVIASNVPGCRHIIQDGFNGLLCKARDSFNLSEILTKMINLSDVERACMGRNARQIILESFDEKFVVEEALQAVRKIKSIS